MTDIQIRKEAGRYVATIPGKPGEAELTFTRDGNVVHADHTGAPDSLRGTGAAAALVEALIHDARTEGFRIDPRCSYVAKKFDDNPDWAELRAV
ncbi:GNAT family N-acetyltransferase [Paracoccus pacificus]|uniref:GNAT family N-acetyltransferase n=1 Tax=Paracoccus pacificus TaxID=1463598 RepID=A0ABW4R7C4_9RHOB